VPALTFTPRDVTLSRANRPLPVLSSYCNSLRPLSLQVS